MANDSSKSATGPSKEEAGQGTGKGHAGKADPNNPRSVPEDGPSGENTVNDGENGGGLWTSGGYVVSGTAYVDDYEKPGPNREAAPEEKDDKEE